MIFELIRHVLILFMLVNVARFSVFIGLKKYAVLRLLNLLLINSSIAFFPTDFAGIMSDVTLSVATTPVEIESKGNGLSWSMKLVSVVDMLLDCIFISPHSW